MASLGLIRHTIIAIFISIARLPALLDAIIGQCVVTCKLANVICVVCRRRADSQETMAREEEWSGAVVEGNIVGFGDESR